MMEEPCNNESWNGKMFHVNSEGHCFFCLIKLEPEAKWTIPRSKHPRHHCLSLSRYLKLDISKVPHFDPSDLLFSEDVESPQIQVALCEGCNSINENFLEHYQKLEQVKLKVTSCLDTICQKMTTSEKLQKSSEDISKKSPSDEVDFTRELRKEILNKCFQKLTRDPFQRRTTDTPRNELVISESSENQSEKEIELDDIKVETSSGGSVPEDHNIAHDQQQQQPIFVFAYDDELQAPQPSSSSSGEPSLKRNMDGNAATSSKNLNTESQNRKVRRKRKGAQDCQMEGHSFIKISNHPGVRTVKSILNPETGKYKCKLCSLEFTFQPNATQHYNKDHVSVRFKCTLCDKEYPAFETYKRHHQAIHMKLVGSFRCDKCDKPFTTRTRLTRHQQMTKTCGVQKPKLHVCEDCGNGYSSPHLLQNHFKTVHLKSQQHACDQCGKIFGQRSNLEMHVKTVHLGIREYGCDLCGKRFKKSDHLKDHLRSVHSVMSR